MKRRIRIQGILIFSALILTIFLYKIVLPIRKGESPDEFLDVLGIALVLFGFLFRISSRGHKEERSRMGKSLVIDGPYALIRNPMYLGTLMVGIGIIFALFALWAIPLFFTIFLLIYMPQIKKEERKLSEQFGHEYGDYFRTVPRYFPKFSSLLRIQHYLSLRLPWIKKELPSLVAVITVIFIIEIIADTRRFGHRELLKESRELFLIFLLCAAIAALFLKRKIHSGENNDRP